MTSGDNEKVNEIIETRSKKMLFIRRIIRVLYVAKRTNQLLQMVNKRK